MKNIEEEVKNMFDGLSREEFIDILESSGLKVEDGEGKVIFEDGSELINDTLQSNISAKISVTIDLVDHYSVDTNFNHYNQRNRIAC